MLKVPEEETGTFSFSLTGQPTDDVTVAVGEASDKFDVSPEAATFTPDNWGSFQTFTIMPTDDADAVDELGVITLTGASTDGGYDDYTDSFIVLIDDDEIIIDISSYSVNVDEGGTATVDVKLLQQPTGWQSTYYFRASNDKISLIDATETTACWCLGFTPDNWQTNQAAHDIVGAQDADDIDDRATISILVLAFDDAFRSANPPDMTVYVADDEVPSIIVTGAETTVDEGTTSTYKVSLNAEPQALRLSTSRQTTLTSRLTRPRGQPRPQPGWTARTW